MIIQSSFNPQRGLASPHFQTLYSTFFNRQQFPAYHEERLELADGDFIDLVWVTDGVAADAPLVILLHGLGGGMQSTYVAGLLNSFKRAGFRALLMFFRGASGEPNRLMRAYHSGETDDFNFLLQSIAAREPYSIKLAVGISLGGNVLLKWMGQHGDPSILHGGVAVSVPFELELAVQRIDQGFSKIYQKHLLKKLQKLFLKKMTYRQDRYPFSQHELLSIRTLYEFDQLVTAPLHGFADAQAYYQQSSSRQYIKNIQIPCLIIHAYDDPFMFPEVIPTASELSESVQLELSQHGGHVGFITNKKQGNGSPFWLETRIPQFLHSVVSKC